jgi:formyltetrahydrofolate-dependent phosphoribosylglycinamide formyltransferase
LIDALNTPQLPSTSIALVLSNRKAAYGLTRAANAVPPIPAAYLALQPFLKAHPGSTRADYDAAVAKIVLEAEPDLVVLAGWMHVFGERFLDSMGLVPIINLHPALPGAFDGTHAIERAYDAFQKGEIDHGGVMVHRVVKEVDRGKPVLVREVEMSQGESLGDFEERIHKTEWEVIVRAAAMVLDEVGSSAECNLGIG